MGYLVKMPKMGMGMTEGLLLEWFVDVGDEVEEEQPIAEFEAEKTAAEITAKEDGVLRQTYVSVGETVDPGTVLGIVAGAGESLSDLQAEVNAKPVQTAESNDGEDESSTITDETTSALATETAIAETRSQTIRASPRARKRAQELDVELAAVAGSGPEGAITVEDIETADGEEGMPKKGGGDMAGTATAESESRPVRASPRARKQAQELDVELTSVTGSGPDGSITVEDVEETATEDRFQQKTESKQKATPKARCRARELGIDIATVRGSGPKGAVTVSDLDASDGRTTTSSDSSTTSSLGSSDSQTVNGKTVLDHRELTGIRKTIAERLGQSYRNAVHVPVHREICVEDALEAAEVMDGYLDADASLTDVILLALSKTLETHPEFNATFDEETITVYEEQDVGLAVDAERGLITPVLRRLNDRSLESLVEERHEVTDLALSGQYTSDDLMGGTFTVTNLGILGVDSFSPIINPPEIAILGIGKMTESPTQTDSGIEFERVINFCLTFDHRTVDGADAARFLETLSTNLQDPMPLILDRA